jgi:SAM-dependent methyltransferase
MHTPAPLARATDTWSHRDYLTTMSSRYQLERIAAQLQTAAADARTIAARREAASKASRPLNPDATARSRAGGVPSRRPPPHDWMSGLQPASPGTGFDPSVPHPARVYGYWLGGKDHYPADREVAEEVIRCRPQVVAGARANRAFLARAVRYLAAGCGIRQFLDIGTGLPAPEGTHDVAQAVDPRSRVVYVDNDQLVLVHARALLTSTPQGACDYVDADLRDTATIIAQAAATLDFTRPVAVLLLAVLHFIPDADDPAGAVAALARRLAPGSYLVISHLTGDFAPGPVSAGILAYNALVPTPLIPRTHAQVTALFGGLPLVPPGVVPLAEWRPAHAGPGPQLADLYAGMARVPRRWPA